VERGLKRQQNFINRIREGTYRESDREIHAHQGLKTRTEGELKKILEWEEVLAKGGGSKNRKEWGASAPEGRGPMGQRTCASCVRYLCRTDYTKRMRKGGGAERKKRKEEGQQRTSRRSSRGKMRWETQRPRAGKESKVRGILLSPKYYV